MKLKSMRLIKLAVGRVGCPVIKVVALVFSLYCSLAMAELRLGELKMRSSAGEPLRAEIPIGQTDISIEDDVIEVNLASDFMFEQAGLTRDIYLAGIELSIAKNSAGDLVVEVAADEPIDRPYIDFLVQLSLPQGRIIREYRLLRNPYEVVDQPLEPIFASNSITKSTSYAKATQPRVYRHRVVVGDTLWNVAKRLRLSHMTIVETMDRLYATNPEAFLNGDSTKLRKGAVISFSPEINISDSRDSSVSETNSNLIIPSVELAPVVDNQPTEDVAATADSIPSNQPLETEQQLELAADQLEIPEPDETPEPEELSHSQAIDSPKIEIISVLDQVEKVQEVNQPSKNQIVLPESELTVATEQKWYLRLGIDPQIVENGLKWLKQLKQVPIDLWVIGGVLLLGMLISWRKAVIKRQAVSENQPSEQVEQQSTADIQSEDAVDTPEADELVESVLNGPFANDYADDIFTEDEDSTQQLSDVGEKLPGIQELEAQLREDRLENQPLSSDFEAVDFAEDTMEIDPLEIKLDMAVLCIEIGDIESAQTILEEIIGEADEAGKAKAREILDSIET